MEIKKIRGGGKKLDNEVILSILKWLQREIMGNVRGKVKPVTFSPV